MNEPCIVCLGVSTGTELCELHREGGWPAVVATKDAELAKLRVENERLTDKIAALEETRAHSCTCDHGEGGRPLHQHDKDCPVRVNLRKRIAPALAMSRLAAALESGDENEELRAALREACDVVEEFYDPCALPCGEDTDEVPNLVMKWRELAGEAAKEIIHET